MSPIGWSLIQAAGVLAPLVAAPSPTWGQSGNNQQLRLPGDVLMQQQRQVNSGLTRMYSGTIVWKISESSGSGTFLNITVTNGEAYCDGANYSPLEPDYPATTGTHKIMGRGQLNLALGVSTRERIERTRRDSVIRENEYQFHVACPWPKDWPSHSGDPLDLKVYIDSYHQPGGGLTLVGNDVRSPEVLTGAWYIRLPDGLEQLSWYLCQNGPPCNPPPPPEKATEMIPPEDDEE